jgi:hypothetical protein
LLLSCSHDELIERGASGSGVISFSTAGNRFSTKVAPMVSDDMRTFRVWGYGSEAGGFLTNLNGAEVSRVSAADDWVYSPMAKWPATGTVDFYAASPADVSFTSSFSTPTFSYTVPDAADQVDLLVAKMSEVNAATHPSPLQLTFAHALSRIGLNVKTDAAGAVFKIEDVKLLNVNSTGTYSFIDGTWSDLTGLTSYNVSVDESWSDGKVLTTQDSVVIGGDNGLMVLPQTAVPGTYQVDVTVPASGTYLSLKATLVKEGGNNVEHTFYFPVVNNTEDRNPLKFEKGKQYTFNLELQAGSGFNAFQITFSGVTSEPWGNGIGALDTQVRVWSRSNIYFQPDDPTDPSCSVGSLTFSENDPSKSDYQGLYFKWGSLIGVAAGAINDTFDEDTYLYIPDLTTGPSEGKYYKVKVEEVNTSDVQAVKAFFDNAASGWTGTNSGNDWGRIPYADDEFTSAQEDRNKSPLTDASDQTYYESYKGDICKFLSDKKENNGSGLTRNWVMPVSNNFGLEGDYTISNTWNNMVNSDATAPENGASVIPSAYYTYILASGETVTFPASGHRSHSIGSLGEVGRYGYYWSSSSVSDASHAYSLYFSNTYVYSAYDDYYRTLGQSVRCVRN